MEEVQQDLFLSHASEDKTDYINPLAQALKDHNVTFWLDNAMIQWGDSVTGKIDEGLRNARFTLLCLSSNFLKKNWPKAEMGAVLEDQITNGIKRVLPLILNSKAEVLAYCPLIGNLDYREYSAGVNQLASEIARLTGTKNDPDTLSITIESANTAKICNLKAPKRASVKWLTDKAQAGMEVNNSYSISASADMHLRWILVDVACEETWQSMPRSEQRKVYALFKTDKGIITSFSDTGRLADIGVKDGTVFQIYGTEDERFDMVHPAPPDFGDSL